MQSQISLILVNMYPLRPIIYLDTDHIGIRYGNYDARIQRFNQSRDYFCIPLLEFALPYPIQDTVNRNYYRLSTMLVAVNNQMSEAS